MNPPPLPVPPPAPKSSAVMAGWICVAIGFGTFWIFGLGFVFFGIAMICAVVAMCTNDVQRGLVFLLSSFASLAICAVIFFVAIFGAGLGTRGSRSESPTPADSLCVASPKDPVKKISVKNYMSHKIRGRRLTQTLRSGVQISASGRLWVRDQLHQC